MKLTMGFLIVALAVGGSSAFVFSLNSPVNPPVQPTEVLKSVSKPLVEPLPTPLFNYLNLLKLILRGLGIPVDRLVEGSRKCVEELGTESVGAVKSLLGVLTYFG